MLRSMTSKLDPALASCEEAVLGAIGARVRASVFFQSSYSSSAVSRPDRCVFSCSFFFSFRPAHPLPPPRPPALLLLTLLLPSH